MPARKARKGTGCGGLKKLFDDGSVVFEVLAHISPDGMKPSTLYLVKILSSLGQSPCDYLGSQVSECRLLAKSVPERGATWDLHLMSCHFGPPCDFLEDL